MTGCSFTDQLRKVLQMAREEAVRLHHEYIGTEHILLGIVREGKGVAVAVLTSLGVEPEDIQQKIEETVKQGKAAAVHASDLPYTFRAKKVLELAMKEAGELDQSCVGTEHLLLGLLREEKGIAGQVLMGFGITPGRVTAALGAVAKTDEGTSTTSDVAEATGSSGRLARLALIIAIVALVIAVLALVSVR